MRTLLLALCLALAACSATHGAATRASGYDPALAARLGADERGMRSYVLVILKTGPYTPASDQERTALFAGHFDNMRRLGEEGRLLAAGPLGENANRYRGVFILNVATTAEADAAMATDPAVAAGIFAYDAYPWYGPAALMEAPAIHRRIAPPAD